MVEGSGASDPAERAANQLPGILMSPLEYARCWNRRREKKEMVWARWCSAGEAKGSRGRRWKELKVWFRRPLIGSDPAFQIPKEGVRNWEVLSKRKGDLVEVVGVGKVGRVCG